MFLVDGTIAICPTLASRQKSLGNVGLLKNGIKLEKVEVRVWQNIKM